MKYEKHLMLDKRFWPSFWTQFFGAFNDNVYKNALVMLITYKSFSLGSFSPEAMVALCGGVFILPFFLFSATAGQICDKYPKDKLMFYIKVWEVIVMLVGAWGFLSESLPTLLITLFFMGVQSSFFGPVKYSILPSILNPNELVQGNALVEMGTFIAILLGTIVGGVLISITDYGVNYVSIAIIVFAIMGTLFSKGIEPIQAACPELEINLGLFKPMKEILIITKSHKGVFLAVLGISWFWFLGASLLSMFPGYVKNVIGAQQDVVTFFLALFSIGVAVGSLLCDKLSRERLELGLVPFGTIGMSLFIFDLYIIGQPNRLSSDPINIIQFLGNPTFIRVVIDLVGLSIFSGFFTVPLYTFVQLKSKSSESSRVIAGLNIINAFFMVISAVLLMAFYRFGFSMPEIFGILAILNLIVSIYIYTIIPEFLIRFCMVIISRLIYRLNVVNHKYIPDKGGAILTCNHVSYVDWMIIAAAIKRPTRFVMYYKFMNIPFLKSFFKGGKVIPIAGKNEDPVILENAWKLIEKELKSGQIVCIFPEGYITRDGKVDGFRPGIEKMLETVNVPVIPITLNGLWGSFFSRKYNERACSKPSVIFKNLFKKVEVEIHSPWNPKDVSAKKLEEFTRSALKK